MLVAWHETSLNCNQALDLISHAFVEPVDETAVDDKLQQLRSIQPSSSQPTLQIFVAVDSYLTAERLECGGDLARLQVHAAPRGLLSGEQSRQNQLSFSGEIATRRGACSHRRCGK